MTKTIIQTENLSFKYPDGTLALRDINIEIKRGEKVAVMDPMVRVNQLFLPTSMVLISLLPD